MAALISTKGRYALRAMVDLAQNKDAGLVPLADIARRQGISSRIICRFFCSFYSSYGRKVFYKSNCLIR